MTTDESDLLRAARDAEAGCDPRGGVALDVVRARLRATGLDAERFDAALLGLEQLGLLDVEGGAGALLLVPR